MKDHRSSASPENTTTAAMPEFESITSEKWEACEAPIRKVLSCVQPTSDSEDKRNDVVAYMRQLIKNAVGVEVLQYGSVPLKTYLPEGDIDLTVVSFYDWECDLPCEVLDVLLAEQVNGNDEFVLKEIQFIDAEVKLVKCIVNDIILDISFNQLSGLCALCFLERVDRLIEKDHLFKRSIILIKSWCYYESHILGAIHGLLSTYALETLVLYIFRMFNASLTTPLKVLYRFLEYFSKFDWDTFCISINGQVNVSSLPDIVVENPSNQPLFGEEFMKEYINMFTIPCKEYVDNIPPFTPKVLNIIDPLKVNNNLGRSIHMGTFFRIKYALGYGARKLGEIMQLPGEDIQDGIKNFFRNTMKMNQSKFIFNTRVSFETLSTASITEVHYEDDIELENINPDVNTRVNVNGGNDLSALSLVPANEESDRNESANSNPDNENEDATANDNPEDEYLKLADLTGDYYGHIRNLMYSQCRKGLPSASVLVHEPVGHPSAIWYQQNSSCVQSYTNGSMMVPEPNLMVHESGPYVPPMGLPMSVTGMGHVPPLSQHHLNQAHSSACELGPPLVINSKGPEPESPEGHGQCSAPSPVHTQRRLVFGSFGPVSQTTPKPVEASFSCARNPASVPNKLLPLMDEIEFPPLSV
ncbi:hypothetical protein R6Q57_017656 [Mikania cordata]